VSTRHPLETHQQQPIASQQSAQPDAAAQFDSEQTQMTINATYGSGNITNFTSVLKELYDGQRPQELGYKDLPFLAMCKKNEKLGGKYYPVPVIYSPSAGVSNTFSNAQNNQLVPKTAEFQITTSDIYSVATIDNKLAMAAKNDQQGFVNSVKLTTDAAIDAASKYLALAMYRTSGTFLGQISSISTGVITLTNRGDACNFEVGQCINYSLSATAAGLLVTGTGGTTIDTSYVLSVDRVAGTITVEDTVGGGAASPAGSYQYNTSTAHTVQAGDFISLDGAGSGTAFNSMSGLQDWITSSAPGALYGVTRTTDRQRLAGTYYDGSSKLIEEAISNALSLVAEAGGRPTHAFMPFASFQALCNELKAKGTVEYTQVQAKDLNIGFDAIKFRGPRGLVTVVPDMACPAADCFLLDMDHWFLGSIDKAPAVFDSDGQPMLRVYNADKLETRIGSYAALYSTKPVSSGRVTLSV
jgi:hypothetical protein